MGNYNINLPVAQIVDEYQSGSSPKELAEKYGVSMSTIWVRLKNEGVETILKTQRDEMRESQDEKWLLVKSDFDSGLFSYQQLSEKWGITYYKLRNRFGKKSYPKNAHIKRSKWQGEEGDRLIASYKSGKTLREVGEEFNLTGERVRQILNKLGVKTRKGRNIDKVNWEELDEMCKEGRPVDEIAHHFGVTRTVIRKYCRYKGFNLPRLPYTPNVSWDWVKAEKAYLGGVPLVKIAEWLNISNYNSIVEVMVRLGHKRRRKPRVQISPQIIHYMVSDYEDGLSLKRIAKKYGLGFATVRQRLVDEGVEIRKPKIK